jgi:hypothetical protein
MAARIGSLRYLERAHACIAGARALRGSRITAASRLRCRRRMTARCLLSCTLGLRTALAAHLTRISYGINGHDKLTDGERWSEEGGSAGGKTRSAPRALNNSSEYRQLIKRWRYARRWPCRYQWRARRRYRASAAGAAERWRAALGISRQPGKRQHVLIIIISLGARKRRWRWRWKRDSRTSGIGGGHHQVKTRVATAISSKLCSLITMAPCLRL